MNQRTDFQTFLALALLVLSAPLLTLFLLASRPRGPYVIYQVYTQDSSTPTQLYMTDVRRGTTQRLSDGTTSDERPAISPDGRFLAFQRREPTALGGELHMMEIATRQTRMVSDAPGSFAQIVWSPDGEELAFTRIYGGGVVAVFLMDADGGNLRPLLDETLYHNYPTYSPDGGKIAFSARTGTWPGITDFMQGHSITRDGQVRRVMELSSTAPVWSPDGRFILLSAQLFYGDPGQVYVIDRENGESQLLRVPGNVSEAIWSPDGSQIAFIAHLGQLADVRVMDSNGQNQRSLKNDPNLIPAQITWSPDGSQIAFYGLVHEQGDIYLLNPATTELRNLTNNPPGIYASSPIWKR